MSDLVLYTLLAFGAGIVFGFVLIARWAQLRIHTIRSSWIMYANHLQSCAVNNRAYSPRVKRCSCGYAEQLKEYRDEVSTGRF